MLKLFWKSRKAVTMIEYALIGSLVSVVAIASLALVGEEVGKALKEVECRLKTKGKDGAASKSACADSGGG
ncbi:MAG: Flp family type IVb pilin [Alphaproteobacteria bacterium GM7ARS4]|nr:Flp family type IVb pilin [Alphaproteobacteria bacterium GM7ARS4]